MEKNFFTKKSFIVIGIVAFLVILITSIFGVIYVKSTVVDNLNFKVVAENIKDNEIDTNTNFLITTPKNYSVNSLKKVIALSPSMEFTIDKVEKNTYLLTPSLELKDNSIYNVTLSRDGEKIDKSWAFQTKTNFKINSTIPMNSSIGVNENTGIEIIFSKPVNNIEEFFEIKPKVKGSFEYKDKTVIFKPDHLFSDTPYKVTIKKGLKNIYDEELIEDYTFAFRTEDTSINYMYLQGEFNSTFIPSDTPKIELSTSDEVKNDKFNVKVYRLNDVNEYVDFLEIHSKEVDSNVGKSSDYNFNMEKYPLHLEFSTNLVQNENERWIDEIRFPDKLEKGWYIADVTSDINKFHFQKAIQISDISVYIYGLNGEVDVWCNDVATGGALNGATIQIGDLAAISNKDGVATINLSDSSKQKVFITTRDNKVFGEYISVLYDKQENLSDNYYTYVYTDREKYFPTDTINFWGTIIPRKKGLNVPDKVTLVLEDKEVEVSVNEKGAFLGKADISNYGSAWVGVRLKVGELEDYLKYLQVVDYIKPVYKITSQFDKEYYRAKDKIKLNLSGKFYDGTSAENLNLKVSYGDGIEKTVTLDENGEGSVTIKPTTKVNNGEVQYINADVEVVGIDEGASNYAYAEYFPTDYYLKTEWDSKKSKLKFSTNKINYDAIKNGVIDYEALYEGESFSQKVLVNIKEVESVKVKTGERYNYYTNMMEPTYRYDTNEKIIDSFDVYINKGEIVEHYLPDVKYKENCTYEAECVFTLPDGYNCYRPLYLYTNDNSYDDMYYYFEREDGYKSLKLGESTTLKLNSKKIDTDFRMIYIISTDRVNKLGVTNKDEISFSMSSELVPNCLVSGAFFDGKYVYQISGRSVFYDKGEKELKINITTDKEVYKPGEEIKASFLVTDTFGKPVETEMVVSAVNEATLVNTANSNPLNYLYKERYHSPKTFVSHKVLDMGGEGGGGGEDDLREKFVDVLLFKSLTTDKYGKASTIFTTSDDLTSWRITGVAVSSDVSAGISVKNVSTSIPFFINQVINDKYTEEDDISFSLRVFGNGLKNIKDKVNYTTKIEGIDETKTKTLELRETAIFNFGKLKAGKYKVTVSAKCNEYSDGIVREIEVLPSLLEVKTRNIMDMVDISDIDPKKYPVKFMFFDEENGDYYRILSKVLEQSDGITNDQKFSKNFIYKRLNELYGEEIYNVEDNLILQMDNAGISKHSYSDSDPLITANIAKISPEKLDRERTISYFYKILNDNKSLPDAVSAAYMGLASFREPILNDVKYLLDNDNGFELIDKINLISALTYIGDYDLAKEYYEKEIKGILTSTDKYKYISEEYEVNTYKANSRLLTILSIINHEDYEGVLNYVLDNLGSDYISSLDLLVCIARYNSYENSKASFEYEINGERKKVDFRERCFEVVTLYEDDMKTFKINKHKGDILVGAEYVSDLSRIENIEDKVKIDKTISGDKIGDYSTVILNISVKDDIDEYLLVTDFIPVSSRFTDAKSRYSEDWYFIDYEKNKVNFCINTKEHKNFSITYKIRNVLSGEYKAENAVITNEDGIILGISNDLKFVTK